MEPVRNQENCPRCDKPRTNYWCKDCESRFIRENYIYWVSVGNGINHLTQDTQKLANKTSDYLEWIPFEKFESVEYACSGGFSSIYSGKIWNNSGRTRVILKRLDGSNEIPDENYIKIKDYQKHLQSAELAETFGITKDPLSNYMIIMKYYESGNLYQFLDRHNGILFWRVIIDILCGIAKGLSKIHAGGKIHGNIHGGNLLVKSTDGITRVHISDLGFNGPSCKVKNPNSIYGVLPFIAPEVLCGEDYSTAFDIYSFGIIMNTLATGKRPWYYRAHDIRLVNDICYGKRLEIPMDTPRYYEDLMKSCWDNDPKNRPSADEIYNKLKESVRNNREPSVENIRWKMYDLSKKEYAHPDIHPDAYFTSRALVFSRK